MAAEAQQAADRATSREMRLAFEELANSWKQLLKEIEQAG
jgi:hypothetical protein